jgi:hypothetical protein
MAMTLSSDAAVLDPTGTSVRLVDLAAERPLVLVFLRHFG